jgi:thiamine phosphate synthase YjbQ (UPF0047 family)
VISLQTKRFSEKTAGHCDITGIAPKVRPAIEKAHIHPALISALVAASSAALTTTKHESRSIQDLKEFVKRPIPSGRPITTTAAATTTGFFASPGHACWSVHRPTYRNWQSLSGNLAASDLG